MPFLTLIFFRTRAHDRTDAGRGGEKLLAAPPPPPTSYHSSGTISDEYQLQQLYPSSLFSPL
jgi:hypothetical protein